MLRSLVCTAQLFLGTSLLLQLPSPAAIACKPCLEPTLAGLLKLADVVAVAEIRKVEVQKRASSEPEPRELSDVRWQVRVARGLKGSPPPELVVEHGDSPPCISAIIPTPGRYLMLLYHRDGRYSPLSYCAQPLFPIDAGDRVKVPPTMSKALGLTGEQVPLKRVEELLTKRVAPLPPT